MYVTLSIFFLILLLLFILYGWGIIMRRSGEEGTGPEDKCSICRKRFLKSDLVEREIGDYRLLYFCNECIQSLSTDARKLHTSDHQ
jgi:hypothetical protein